MMKMIVAILRDEDTEAVTNALNEKEYCVTRIASTGGFLRQGRSTLMIGAAEDKIDDAINLINDHCTPTVEPILRRATLFILNVEHFEEL